MDNQAIINDIINNEELEQKANNLVNRYSNGEWIQAGDILVYKDVASAFRKLVWALRRQAKEDA
jgi:hypothetical protein